jgi:hypothetical protein
MHRITDEMNKRTAQLMRDQRQGISHQVRSDALKDVATDGAIELKFKAAAVYFQGFEFQIWENILDDDEALRQSLLTVAAEEFLLSFRGVIDGKRKSPDPLSTDDKMKSLLAFGATVEQVNQIQVDASRKPGSGFPIISMHDILANGLRAKAQMDASPGAYFPSYVYKVLLYEDEATYVFQLRANIMLGMVIDKISDASQMTLTQKLGMLFNALGWSSSWTAKFSKINSVEIREITRYLDEVRKSIELLKELRSGPDTNDKIETLLKRVKIEKDPNASQDKAIATHEFEMKLQSILPMI